MCACVCVHVSRSFWCHVEAGQGAVPGQTLGRRVASLQDALALSWSSAAQDRHASVCAKRPEEASDGGQS